MIFRVKQKLKHNHIYLMYKILSISILVGCSLWLVGTLLAFVNLKAPIDGPLSRAAFAFQVVGEPLFIISLSLIVIILSVQLIIEAWRMGNKS